jgi:hypothetical protein
MPGEADGFGGKWSGCQRTLVMCMHVYTLRGPNSRTVFGQRALSSETLEGRFRCPTSIYGEKARAGCPPVRPLRIRDVEVFICVARRVSWFRLGPWRCHSSFGRVRNRDNRIELTRYHLVVFYRSLQCASKLLAGCRRTSVWRVAWLRVAKGGRRYMGQRATPRKLGYPRRK